MKWLQATAVAGGLGLASLGLPLTPAHAGGTYVTGEVQCLSMDVEGVWIAAKNGGSWWANWWTNGDPTDAHYGYTLPYGGDYAVHVGCGGSRQHWNTPTYSDYVSGTNNDFFCYDQPNAGYAYKYCQHTN